MANEISRRSQGSSWHRRGSTGTARRPRRSVQPPRRADGQAAEHYGDDAGPASPGAAARPRRRGRYTYVARTNRSLPVPADPRPRLPDAGDPVRLTEELPGLGDPQPCRVNEEGPADQPVVRAKKNGSPGARTRNSRRRWLPEIDLRHPGRSARTGTNCRRSPPYTPASANPAIAPRPANRHRRAGGPRLSADKNGGRAQRRSERAKRIPRSTNRRFVLNLWTSYMRSSSPFPD